MKIFIFLVKNMRVLCLFRNYGFWLDFEGFSQVFWSQKLKNIRFYRNWYYKCVNTLYLYLFLKKMLRDMHTIGTNWKYVNFAQILNCFPSTAHICGSKNVPCGCIQNEKTLFLKVYIVSEKSVILLSSFIRNSLLANIAKMWSKFCCFWLFLAVFEEFGTPPSTHQNAQNFLCSI